MEIYPLTNVTIDLLSDQIGLPNEALSMMIAINAVLQFVTVAVDVWGLQGETVCFDRDNKKKQTSAAA